MVTYVFDGSFEGLLTALFEFYEYRPAEVRLMPETHYEPSLLDNAHFVITDETKAGRVWAGLCKKLDARWQQVFYNNYLSELPQAFQDMFCFARYIFDSPAGAEKNFGNPYVTSLTQTARKVSRERHRMKAFIRFQKTADGIYYAPVEPDFNVLPLIAVFFKDRYADQKWVIYDMKRKYGLYYDLNKVHAINYEFTESLKNSAQLPPETLDATEELASHLWKDYFNSTNIPARRNMKLHLQHVPKRYWKYLNEKEGKN